MARENCCKNKRRSSVWYGNVKKFSCQHCEGAIWPLSPNGRFCLIQNKMLHKRQNVCFHVLIRSRLNLFIAIRYLQVNQHRQIKNKWQRRIQGTGCGGTSYLASLLPTHLHEPFSSFRNAWNGVLDWKIGRIFREAWLWTPIESCASGARHSANGVESCSGIPGSALEWPIAIASWLFSLITEVF